VAKVDFAWELGAGTGHVATLQPIATAMKARGHEVRFLQRDASAGADLADAAAIPREAAPVWVGPVRYPNPLNFGEILHNFGYQELGSLAPLVDAWRERLRTTHMVIANVAPAAHLAALTLGIPSFEISQGFHVPPPAMPAPPLRDWEPAPRARLEAADRRVLNAINQVLARHGAAPLDSIGALFSGRALLLTYPELDIYPERGPSDYYGITDTAEGRALPEWPEGGGACVFAYLYHYYPRLEPLIAALRAAGFPTIVFCRGLAPELRERYGGGSLAFPREPVAVSQLLPGADLVISHASHQMTAQALLAGKPLLMLPTQLEQFLIMRRVVRYGAGLGIAQDAANPDFAAALAELTGNRAYAARAREFAQRYASHSRQAALTTMIARCESALAVSS
jgi:UDP:flavonoid glycosyltransferase YjiC (YdhE family)